MPKSVPEALQIDEDTGTTYWWDAIKKEMDKVMVAFDVEEELTTDNVRQGVARGDFIGYQEIACHWVFDVKMDLTRKARLVAGGDMTGLPWSSTYSSVVTRESVRIAFLIAGLNDLDVLACDIGNAYLNAPCQEKVWFEAGAEFGSRKGRPVKVVQALFGLKMSGTSWRATLVATLTEMGFSSSRADADVWM